MLQWFQAGVLKPGELGWDIFDYKLIFGKMATLEYMAFNEFIELDEFLAKITDDFAQTMRLVSY